MMPGGRGTVAAMPIVFVHGVNNRRGPGYDATVAGRNALFRNVFLPAGWGEDPGTERESYEVRVGYHDLDPALRAFAAASSVSIKAVLHAAHLKVLSQLTEQESFFTGLVLSPEDACARVGLRAEGEDR